MALWLQVLAGSCDWEKGGTENDSSEVSLLTRYDIGSCSLARVEAILSAAGGWPLLVWGAFARSRTQNAENQGGAYALTGHPESAKRPNGRRSAEGCRRARDGRRALRHHPVIKCETQGNEQGQITMLYEHPELHKHTL